MAKKPSASRSANKPAKAKKPEKKKKPASAKIKKKSSKPAKKSPPEKKTATKAAKESKPSKPAKASAKSAVKKPAKISKPVKPEQSSSSKNNGKKTLAKPAMIVKDKPVKKVKPDAVPVAAPPVQVLPKVGIPAGIVPPKPMAKKPKMDFGDFIPNLPVRPSVAKPGEEVVIDRPKAAYIPKKVAEAPKIYVRQMDAKEEIKKEPISKDKMRFPITTDELKKGVTVEQKLRALYDLQLIDSRIDKMRSVRGELPLEVQDLEDEIAQLETRIGNLEKETQTLEKDTAGKKLAIKDAENLIKKNKEQQNKVRNNREFESLSKEIEFQELEIQLHDKKIKDYAVSKVQKAEALEGSNSKMKDRKGDLKVKKTELDAIIKETEKEEKFLVAKSAEAQSLIELRLLQAYQRIRASSRNGLAVVPIEREASAGSFITIPPQKQMDVASRKKVMVDEHSGRILVDAELAREEEERIEFLLGEAMKKK